MNPEILFAIATSKPVYFKLHESSQWTQLTPDHTVKVLNNALHWRLELPQDALPWQVKNALANPDHSKAYRKGWLDCCMVLLPELEDACTAARKELE